MVEAAGQPKKFESLRKFIISPRYHNSLLTLSIPEYRCIRTQIGTEEFFPGVSLPGRWPVSDIGGRRLRIVEVDGTEERLEAETKTV